MQQLSTHNLLPSKKKGGWGKKTRYDLTLTTETVNRAKTMTDNFSGLVDGLLSRWVKRQKP